MIFQVFEVEDLRIMIYGQLNPFSIVRLSVTYREMRDILYTTELKRWNVGNWDVDTHLVRFVDDHLRFWSILGKCNAIVFGSNALQLIEGVCFEDNDLDIYFNDMNGMVSFGTYLQ